jgi:hypothetical protein
MSHPHAYFWFRFSSHASPKPIYIYISTPSIHPHHHHHHRNYFIHIHIVKISNKKGSPESRTLGRWVQLQKAHLREYDDDRSTTPTAMTPVRRQRLLDLGIVQAKPKSLKLRDQVYDRSFQKKIQELRAFKVEHGTCILL